MRKFDYSFLNNGLLPAKSCEPNLQYCRTENHGRGAQARIHAEFLRSWRPIARVQSIKSSNAIEGIVTSDERIAAIVNQNSAPLNHNEAEIAGYRDALNEIHLGYEHIDFRQQRYSAAARNDDELCGL